MNRNYHMLYEEITLAPWGGGTRRSDPFQLGDADTLAAVDNELSGIRGVEAKFGLLAAFTKLIADNRNNEEVVKEVRELQNELAEAKEYNDVCVILDKAKEVFNKVGYTIIY